ncbi:MAG TPA: hypothetical protein VFY65_10950 [Longimicrobium sp.]|nr:hypothetical protein [Longimicrobium sp.]
MKKLTLRLDDLTVEGFSTTPPANGRGTVHGEQGTFPTYCTCVHATCDPTCWTCEATCDDYTCWYTCEQTCDDFTCADTCGFSNCETRCGAGTSCRCPLEPIYP